MRRNLTAGEATLWTLLRKGNIDGLRFRRQAPIGRFIVDFLCASRRLVVEVDGSVHGRAIYDHEGSAQRQAWLEAQGYTVLRVKDAQVFERPDLIVAKIREVAAQTPIRASGPPSP